MSTILVRFVLAYALVAWAPGAVSWAQDAAWISPSEHQRVILPKLSPPQAVAGGRGRDRGQVGRAEAGPARAGAEGDPAQGRRETQGQGREMENRVGVAEKGPQHGQEERRGHASFPLRPLTGTGSAVLRPTGSGQG